VATEQAILTEDLGASGYINREDVASLVLQVLASTDGVTTRKELTAVANRFWASYSKI